MTTSAGSLPSTGDSAWNSFFLSFVLFFGLFGLRQKPSCDRQIFLLPSSFGESSLAWISLTPAARGVSVSVSVAPAAALRLRLGLGLRLRSFMHAGYVSGKLRAISQRYI